MPLPIQSSKIHEIEFYEPPSPNEFLDGVAQVLRGPDATWASGSGISFRCLRISDDKRTYIIEELVSKIDISTKLSDYTKIVEITLTCETCATKYQTWKIVGDDWRKDKYWLYTPHCPACPPMSPDVWLAGLDYYSERPTIVTASLPVSINNVDMSDFE